MSSAPAGVTGWLAAEKLVSQLETADAAISIYTVLHSKAQHIPDGTLSKTSLEFKP